MQKLFLSLALVGTMNLAFAALDTEAIPEEKEIITQLEKLRIQSSDCNGVRVDMLNKFYAHAAGDEHGFKSGADAKKAVELLDAAKPVDPALVDRILTRLMEPKANIRFEKIVPRFFGALCTPFERSALVRRLIGGTPGAKDFPAPAAVRSTLLNYAADLGSHPDSLSFVLGTDILWNALKGNWFKTTPELMGQVGDLRTQLMRFRERTMASRKKIFSTSPKGTEEASPEETQQLAQLVRGEFEFTRKTKPGYLKILEQLRQLNP